jgi:hypothetical protein
MVMRHYSLTINYWMYRQPVSNDNLEYHFEAHLMRFFAYLYTYPFGAESVQPMARHFNQVPVVCIDISLSGLCVCMYVCAPL